MRDKRNSDGMRTIRVLLVEDHLVTRVGLRTILERTQDIVVAGEAANGQEALRAVEELSPDVILMDVSMPVMDGIEASERILEEHPEMKVIMLTARESDSYIFASLSAGALGYCFKDLQPDQLYTAIRSVFEGNVWFDEPIAMRVFEHYVSQAKPVTSQGQVAGTSPSWEEPSGQSRCSVPAQLSPREREVLELIVDGRSNQEIAAKLTISLATAKTHVRNVLYKLKVDDRTQAAVKAMRRGLV